MHDEHLDDLIARAAPHYHAPPTPDLDRLWAGIEASRGRPARTTRAVRWRTPLAIAATATLAFTLGRVTSTGTPTPAARDAGDLAPTAGAAVAGVATDLLGQTAVLLASLPQDPSTDANAFARQAGDLLITTRLLLDAPDTQRNAALAEVLRDLELVLAQAARLQGHAASSELELITDAMRQQDLVPRLRTVAAGLYAGD